MAITGDNGNNHLDGNGADDTIKGYGGNDILHGFGGNDSLWGGDGADDMDGGSGNDTAVYADSTAGVFVNLMNGTGSGGFAEGDTLNNIENVTGSSYADSLWGNNSANILSGGGGSDTLKGYGGADTLNGGTGDDFLYGMDGADILNGGSGTDYLNGGANNDTLDGGAGVDTMVGGTGSDTYYVNDANDVVTELSFEGNDTVYSSAFSYVLAPGVWVETLSLDTATDTGVYATGNGADNTIFGNVNDNVLDGGAGNDSLSGLGGNDTFVFHAGQAHGDVVYEFNGNGGAVGDVLRFEGYGTLAEGATFHQLTATEWQITSADGTVSEVITLAAGAVIDTSTDIMFV